MPNVDSSILSVSTKFAPVDQLAESIGLSPIQFRFKSEWEHQVSADYKRMVAHDHVNQNHANISE